MKCRNGAEWWTAVSRPITLAAVVGDRSKSTLAEEDDDARRIAISDIRRTGTEGAADLADGGIGAHGCRRLVRNF